MTTSIKKTLHCKTLVYTHPHSNKNWMSVDSLFGHGTLPNCRVCFVVPIEIDKVQMILLKVIRNINPSDKFFIKDIFTFFL